MLFAAFDALRQSFAGTSSAELSWVLNGYTVVYAAMLIPAGGLADAHGRRRISGLRCSAFSGMAHRRKGCASLRRRLVDARLHVHCVGRFSE